jgi:hypothetical protein
MNAIAKHFPLNSKTLEDLQEIADSYIRFYRAKDKALEGFRCTGCGEKYEDHVGFDSICPDPLRLEPNMPPLRFLPGKPLKPPTYFTLAPHRCEALLADSQDTYGVFCGKRCEPGKTLCEEHHE